MPELAEILAIHELLRNAIDPTCHVSYTDANQQLWTEPLGVDHIRCKGKVLAIELGTRHILLMHLMLHGQVLLVEADESPNVLPAGTHIIFSCIITDHITHNEVRTRRFELRNVHTEYDHSVSIAWAKCVSWTEGRTYLDALAPSLEQSSRQAFCSAIANVTHQRNIESTLVDQHALVSGVGRWMCTHMLQAAGLCGKEKVCQLTRAQAECLYDSGMMLIRELVPRLLLDTPLSDVYQQSKLLRPIVAEQLITNFPALKALSSAAAANPMQQFFARKHPYKHTPLSL
jgi:formamidopyrimidine-DNA glycosylase